MVKTKTWKFPLRENFHIYSLCYTQDSSSLCLKKHIMHFKLSFILTVHHIFVFQKKKTTGI